MRELFELWAIEPPREWQIQRYGFEASWPGQYKNYYTQCAWEAWCAAQGVEADNE